MIDLATESRPEVLREVALLQQQEIGKLHVRLSQLASELARVRGEDATAALQLELMRLQEQLATAQQRLFGRSSERRPLHNAEPTPPPTAPRTGHGPRSQPTLPLVEVVHTLDVPDQACTACGGGLAEMAGQFEESQEIDVVAASYRIVQHRRQKYRCRCGGCVETALGPPKLIPGGRYSIDFCVHVAVSKYLDHLPLARQVRQMARAGLTIDTQTLWDQLLALSRHLVPSYEALHRFVLEARVIGADETTWPLLEKGGSKRWYAWSAAREDTVVYRIAAGRSTEAARDLLRDYAGIVMCDGYAAYGTLARAPDGGGFTRAHCWSHVRRKFLEAEPAHPEAQRGVAWIGELYDVERDVEKAEVLDPAAHRLSLRQERSRPIVEALRAWMTTVPSLSQSSLGKALAYTDTLWPGLVRFLDDPAIPLDNNTTERALRGVVLGRKNHYGSKSQRGTEVAALFYSLLESAKLSGLEPSRYLAEATRRAIANPGTATLPRDLLPA